MLCTLFQRSLLTIFNVAYNGFYSHFHQKCTKYILIPIFKTRVWCIGYFILFEAQQRSFRVCDDTIYTAGHGWGIFSVWHINHNCAQLITMLECAFKLYTPGQKFIDFFQRAVTSRWRGKSTICQFRKGNTSYFYKFVKFHRRRSNGHGPMSLNNKQRFKFAMSTYTRPAHHCDQRWTCVLTALRESHSGPNLQQYQLRQLSPRLTRFHGIVKFYIFIHCIE